jgi:uncharacterized protein (TIGR02118 family)
MFKVVSLMKRPEGVSLEEFRKWALEDHAPLGKKIPGLRRYRISVVLEDNPDLPADVVAELFFDDDQARAAAFATPEGKAAGADAAANAGFRVHLLTEETTVIE